MQKSKTALTNILIEESCNDEYRKALQNFWNIQRLCLGIEELEEKDVIYQYKLGISDDKIVVSVQAYVVIDFIKKSFEKLKYKISEGGVLKAAEFGVPQTRERFILIGVSEEQYDEGLGVELPKPILKNSSEFYSVYDAISDLEAYEPTTGSMSEKIERHLDRAPENFYEKIVFNEDNDIIYNHVCTATRDKAKERFALINQGENFHNLPEAYKDTYDNPNRTQNTIYKRLRYDEPSDTVINVRKSMWIHPTKNRAISAREAARLQSFPDSYEFVGTKDSVYQQIGNAVPPILGRAVAEKVLELLKCKEKYKKLKEIYEDFKKVE